MIAVIFEVWPKPERRQEYLDIAGTLRRHLETIDGFKTRTPFFSEVNLHVDYALRLGGGRRVTLIGDLFNLFNQKTVLDYNNFTESTFASPNPNFGQPRSLADGPAIQAPFGVRLGLRYAF